MENVQNSYFLLCYIVINMIELNNYFYYFIEIYLKVCFEINLTSLNICLF